MVLQGIILLLTEFGPATSAAAATPTAAAAAAPDIGPGVGKKKGKKKKAAGAAAEEPTDTSDADRVAAMIASGGDVNVLDSVALEVSDPKIGKYRTIMSCFAPNSHDDTSILSLPLNL